MTMRKLWIVVDMLACDQCWVACAPVATLSSAPLSQHHWQCILYPHCSGDLATAHGWHQLMAASCCPLPCLPSTPPTISCPQHGSAARQHLMLTSGGQGGTGGQLRWTEVSEVACGGPVD